MTMRLAIGVLLALNLLYIMWVMVRPEARDPVESVNAPVSSLQLVVAEGDSERLAVANVVDSSQLALAGEYGARGAQQFCAEIGPFAEVVHPPAAEGQSAAAWEVLTRQRQVSVRYRAYVATVPNRVAALAQLEAVRATITELDADIDSYLVTGGELENAVSLGVFAGHANALRVQAVLADRQVDVLVREEPVYQDEYWLRVFSEKPVDFSRENEFKARFGDTMAGLAQNVCETIAQRD